MLKITYKRIFFLITIVTVSLFAYSISADSNNPSDFKIINPSPKENLISISINDNITFSVDNTNYNSINWYVNDKLVKSDSNNYTFIMPDLNTQNIKVIISINDSFLKKSWIIKNKEKSIPNKLKNSDKIVLIAIGLNIFIIILYLILKKF